MYNIRKNLLSAFSATTSNCVGASVLSAAAGSPFGALGFAVAAFLGIKNKWQVKNTQPIQEKGFKPSKGFSPFDKITAFLIKELQSPLLIGNVLCASSGANALDSFWDLVTQGSELAVPNTLRCGAWTMGFLADVALRSLDAKTYLNSETSNSVDDNLDVPENNGLSKIISVLQNNPAILFNATNICFGLLQFQDSSGMSPIAAGIGGCAIGASVYAIGHTIRKMRITSNDNAMALHKPDYTTNWCQAGSTAGTTLVALSNGNYAFAAAQALFAIGALQIIRQMEENRKKELSANNPKPPTLEI